MKTPYWPTVGMAAAIFRAMASFRAADSGRPFPNSPTVCLSDLACSERCLMALSTSAGDSLSPRPTVRLVLLRWPRTASALAPPKRNGERVMVTLAAARSEAFNKSRAGQMRRTKMQKKNVYHRAGFGQPRVCLLRSPSRACRGRLQSCPECLPPA